MPIFQFSAMDANGKERKGKREARSEEEVSSYLHQLRPNEVPSFTFRWMQIVSDKNILAHLSKEQSYVSYFVLLADFVVAVLNIDSNKEEILEK